MGRGEWESLLLRLSRGGGEMAGFEEGLFSAVDGIDCL